MPKLEFVRVYAKEYRSRLSKFARSPSPQIVNSSRVEEENKYDVADLGRRDEQLQAPDKELQKEPFEELQKEPFEEPQKEPFEEPQKEPFEEPPKEPFEEPRNDQPPAVDQPDSFEQTPITAPVVVDNVLPEVQALEQPNQATNNEVPVAEAQGSASVEQADTPQVEAPQNEVDKPAEAPQNEVDVTDKQAEAPQNEVDVTDKQAEAPQNEVGVAEKPAEAPQVEADSADKQAEVPQEEVDGAEQPADKEEGVEPAHAHATYQISQNEAATYTLKQLQTVCLDHNIAARGTKADLRQRLIQANVIV